MDRQEFSGEFSLTVNSLPADAGDQLEFALIKNSINNYTITYQGKLDMTTNQMVYNFFLKGQIKRRLPGTDQPAADRQYALYQSFRHHQLPENVRRQ